MAERKPGVLAGFKTFIMRGNVVDLAVAVVIGTAFGAVVTALVGDVVTPLIGAIFRTPNFQTLHATVNHSRIPYGAFINAVIAFVLIATAVYFLIVVPLNRLAARRARGQPSPDPTTRPCPECLSEIPIAATRCAFCTSEVPPVVAAS